MAGSGSTALAEETLQRRAWTIGDVEGTALVYAPVDAAESPSLLVFVFCGHGGRSQNMARLIALHSLWPEAIVVYPQSLNTPGRLTAQKRAGGTNPPARLPLA